LFVAVDAQLAAATPQIGVGEESYIFGARLGRLNSTGAGACAGCLIPTNLYFAEADFFQTNGDNFVIDGLGPPNLPSDGMKCATWQVFESAPHGPTGPCPAIVPVRNSTWGSLKSLYR